MWSFLVFALDALAIAAQALTGKALGAGDVAAARSATATMIRWGVWGGAVLGLALLAVHTVLPAAFTSDEAVRSALAAALVVVALGQPLSGYVFVVDGVLIGAGDGRWLAKAMVATLVLYLPRAGRPPRGRHAARRRRHRRAGAGAGRPVGGVHRLHGHPRCAVLVADPVRRLGRDRRLALGLASGRAQVATRARRRRRNSPTYDTTTTTAASTWIWRVYRSG